MEDGQCPPDLCPIDLERHADLCAQFRADSFRVSFGGDECVYQEHATSPTAVHPDGRGRARYVTWLVQRMREFPGSGVHVWHHDAVVGQIEMGRFRGDAAVGYVNLLSLIPAYRGTAVVHNWSRTPWRFSGARATSACV
jgi:hypothetical protein